MRPGPPLLLPYLILALLILALLTVTPLAARSQVEPTRAGSGSEAESGPPPEPVRLSLEVFGDTARVEVRDLPAGANEEAARSALLEMRRLAELADPTALEPSDGGVADLNAHAGAGPHPVDPELLELLERAQDFCRWSGRANGPLGGRLYHLWGLRSPALARPTPQQLLDASASAECDRLELDRTVGTAELAAGSQVDPWPFARGWAVDRAVEVLREQGATNGLVEIGRVRRGFGPGPGGRGWRVTLPVPPGSSRPLGRVWLEDEALAMVHFEDRSIRLAGDRIVPYLDQRSGRPVDGVVAVLAVSETALDAHGLASTLLITGPRRGQFLAGQLRPLPSVRWLLGTGQGRPAITDYNWSRLRSRR